MNVVSILLSVPALVVAVVWAVVGVTGLIGRLPGNRWVGVRTPETASIA